eukprot:scaffold11948_cov107-Isochrysis_galbana.AAC.2
MLAPLEFCCALGTGSSSRRDGTPPKPRQKRSVSSSSVTIRMLPPLHQQVLRLVHIMTSLVSASITSPRELAAALSAARSFRLVSVSSGLPRASRPAADPPSAPAATATAVGCAARASAAAARASAATARASASSVRRTAASSPPWSTGPSKPAPAKRPPPAAPPRTVLLAALTKTMSTSASAAKASSSCDILIAQQVFAGVVNGKWQALLRLQSLRRTALSVHRRCLSSQRYNKDASLHRDIIRTGTPLTGRTGGGGGGGWRGHPTTKAPGGGK